MIKVGKGDTVEFWEQITQASGVTGQSPTFLLQRASDDKYLQSDTSTWSSGTDSIDFVEHDSTDLPGYYNYRWVIPAQNTYRRFGRNTDTSGYGFELMEVYDSFPVITEYGETNNTAIDTRASGSGMKNNCVKLAALQASGDRNMEE